MKLAGYWFKSAGFEIGPGEEEFKWPATLALTHLRMLPPAAYKGARCHRCGLMLIIVALVSIYRASP